MLGILRKKKLELGRENGMIDDVSRVGFCFVVWDGMKYEGIFYSS